MPTFFPLINLKQLSQAFFLDSLRASLLKYAVWGFIITLEKAIQYTLENSNDVKIAKNELKINYMCQSPETMKDDYKFDVILNMEIVEHVEDINLFLFMIPF